jgi:S-adenosylmethionine hydrolase
MILDHQSKNTNQQIKRIVIFTDCVDCSYNEMHQVLVNEVERLGDGNINISPLVPIKNFSVVNASFNLRLMAEICPPESTLFVVVVHGVRSAPERIFGRTRKGLLFVGNNSGYFNWLIEDFGLDFVYENKTTHEVNGKSFGGKYVQIPTAAKIVTGTPFDQLGTHKSEDYLSKFSIPYGTVVHTDNFGLMKIKAPRLDNLKDGTKIKIYVNDEFRAEGIFSEKFKKQKDGTWVLFTGSSLYGLPELGCVRSQNSAHQLGVCEGDVISWKF